MKRLLTTGIFFLCSLLTFAQSSGFTGSGSGTENDPYLIFHPYQLNQLRHILNQSGVYFKLMANIDLTEFLEDENPEQGWQPIGNSSSAAFKGILDGNGKTIKGLWIKRTSADNVGFFGYTDGATIKNVTIKASKIEGKENVAGVSGYSENSTISGCNFSGTIKGTSNVGSYIGKGYSSSLLNNIAKGNVTATGDKVGGFIGEGSSLKISGCTFNNCIIKGVNYVGGFIGEGSSLKISGCTLNDGNVEGVNYVGGCCGTMDGQMEDEEMEDEEMETEPISDIFIHANITGVDYIGGLSGKSNNIGCDNIGYSGEIKGSSYVGGLIGESDNSDSYHINRSFAICNVTSTGDYIGGLIGKQNGDYYYRYYSYHYCGSILTNSYHSGSVTGSNYVGGLVGYKQYGSISNSYAIGSVAGNQYIGGLLGYQCNNTTLTNSVAINTRLTATTGDVNRLVGSNSGTIGAIGSVDENKSYNRTIVINQGVAQEITDDLMNGTGVSATTLKFKATYVAMGWDFTDAWEIQETECYPYMKSQTAPPIILSKVVSGETTISGKCVDGGKVVLEIDGEKQQMSSIGNEFSFTVSPLQAGHEVRISAKANGKEHSYYTTEVVSFLGKGTEKDPYQVYTAADLTSVYRKGYYKLMNDIDLTDYINKYYASEGWESVGREGCETIHFDGANHKITGLWCNSTRDNTGLFSCFANGYIKNLTVQTAKGKQVKGGNCTGIIIGKLINGEMTNCKAYGTVSAETPVGGMIGKLDGGKLLKCLANVTINATGGNSYVGGLVGEVNGDVDQCLSGGTLTADGENSYVGGLVALNGESSNITNSYSSAITHSSYNAAGLVAYNYGKVDKCYALGDVFSKNYGAGVIGYNDGPSAIVSLCVAMNNKIEVTWESQQSSQGGGYGQRIIGGFKNGAPAPEMNNYALKTMQVSQGNNKPQTVSDDILNGTAKTKTKLMTSSTFKNLGWDMTAIWSLKAGESYPWLRKNLAIVGINIPATLIIENGKTEELTPTFYPSTSSLDQSVTWKSSNTKVVTVSSSGKVKGVKVGSATITCTSVSSGASTTCLVTVGSVSLNKSELFIKRGKSEVLTPTFNPSTLSDKSVTWQSSNTKVATVSETGEVVGVKVGTATITCTSTSGGFVATCQVTVGAVLLDNKKLFVQKGETAVLTPSVYPSSLSDKSVKWKSSNTKVATVTKDGKITGIKSGTATITCTSVATGLSSTCAVTVGYVKLNETEVIIQKEKTFTLTPTVYPSSLSDKSVTWKSSNTDVATVSSTGKVKGVKDGTATITCTSKATGLSTTCKVIISYVKLSKTEAVVEKNKTLTLKATVYPSSFTDKSVTWESSNPSVATVTSSGKVKGIKDGKATITCTSNATGLKTTCKVTVGYVKLDMAEVTVKKGKTVTLTPTVYPSTLSDKSVTWESSDKSIATVTSTGKVKGISGGIATITCTSVATGLSTTCTVTVTATSSTRSLEGDDDELTGIDELNVDPAEVQPFDVYDLSGRKVAHQVTSLEGLPNGIYIVNGKKMLKK